MSTKTINRLTIPHEKIMSVALTNIKTFKAEQIQRAEDRANNHTGYRTADDNYCKHGSYIGDPYGGDFLCWYCESGISDYEFAIGNAWTIASRAADRYETLLSKVQVCARAMGEHHAGTPIFLREMKDALDEMIAIQDKWLY